MALGNWWKNCWFHVSLKVMLIYLFKPKKIFSNLNAYIELTVLIMTETCKTSGLSLPCIFSIQTRLHEYSFCLSSVVLKEYGAWGRGKGKVKEYENRLPNTYRKVWMCLCLSTHLHLICFMHCCTCVEASGNKRSLCIGYLLF